MKVSFEKALSFTLHWEGGYVDNPNDPGGETNLGISKNSYPKVDIFNLTREQASDIYYKDYWLKGRCNDIPHPANIAHFDACVNTGITQAVKFLQRAAVTQDDGIIGPMTLQAVNDCEPKQLALSTVGERENFYRTLADRKPKFAEFLKGWLNRTNSLSELIEDSE